MFQMMCETVEKSNECQRFCGLARIELVFIHGRIASRRTFMFGGTDIEQSIGSTLLSRPTTCDSR
jgi:hypothetical protein